MINPGIVALVPIVIWTTRCAAQSGAHERAPAVNEEVAVMDSARELPAWHEMITNVPGDWAAGAETTVRGSNVPAVAGLCLLTGGLMMADQWLYRNARDLYARSSPVRSGSDLFVQVGNGGTHLAVAAGFGLYGWIASDSRSVRTASQTAEALIASGIVVQVLKHITGRESPVEATREGGKWHFFPSWKEYQHHPARYYAFPSGHITTTMSTVTVIVENYPEVAWLRPVGYVLVGLVGISLVNVGYHWYSDLPLGLALGYSMGMIAAHRELLSRDAPKGDETAPRVRLSPAFTPAGGGLMLAVSF